MVTEYKLADEFFAGLRRRVLLRTLPTLLLSVGVGIYVSYANGNVSPLMMLVVFALLAGVMAFTLQRSIRRQCESFRTFRLRVTEDRTIREQDGYPELEIPFASMVNVREDPANGLTVRGTDQFQVLFVPAALENYAEVRATLAQHRAIEAVVPRRAWFWNSFVVGLATVGLYAVCFLADSRVYILVAGTLLLVVLGGSFYFTLRSPNIDKRSKRALWFMPLVVITIIARLMTLDPTGRLAARLEKLSDAGRYRDVVQSGTAGLGSGQLTAEACATLANAYYELDDLSHALEFARRALAMNPTAERPARLVVIVLRDQENYDEAVRFGQEWLKTNAQGAKIYRDLAMAAHDAGHLPLAYELATEGFKRRSADPRMAGVYFYYAALNRAPADVHAEAVKWCEQNSPDTYFWAQLGKGLSDAKAASLALPVLLKALRLGSDDRGVVTEIMDSYRELGDAEMASAFVESYFETHEPTVAIWRSLGAIYYDKDMYDEALDATNKAYALDPDDPIVISNLIFTLHELERSTEGIEIGKKWLATSKRPATAALHRALGHVYFGRDQLPNAEHHYREALKINPTYVYSARDLISTLINDHRPAEAVGFGEQWSRDHPDIQDSSFDEALARARTEAQETKSLSAPLSEK